MKMIFKLTLLIMLAISVSYCSSETKPGSDSLVKKRIKQSIDIKGMGMLKDINIESVEKVNDTTFKAICSFLNPAMNKEVRITRNYYFTANHDTITGSEDILTQMKSEGEWVDTNW